MSNQRNFATQNGFSKSKTATHFAIEAKVNVKTRHITLENLLVAMKAYTD